MASTTKASDRSRPFAPAMRRSVTLNAVLPRNCWAVLILGIIVGLIAFVMPAATMLALVPLFAAYMLVEGVFAIFAAVRAAQYDRWEFRAGGIADIVAGLVTVLWRGFRRLWRASGGGAADRRLVGADLGGLAMAFSPQSAK